MNEAVGIKSRYTMNGGGKWLVRPFKRQEFWKFIGCILSAVTYGKKVHKLFSDIPKASCSMAPPKLRRDVCGNTDLYKVCCYHYRHSYIYACHLIILSYTIFFHFLDVSLGNYLSLSLTGLWHDKLPRRSEAYR